jgi:hypothetical protein
MSRPYLNEILASGIIATLTVPSFKLVDNCTRHSIIITASNNSSGTVVIRGRTENGTEHNLHLQRIATGTTIVADYDRPIYKIAAIVPTYSVGTFSVEYQGCK